jgi:hypothetical protein
MKTIAMPKKKQTTDVLTENKKEMVKNGSKIKDKEAGSKLVGNPSALIQLMIPNADKQREAADQIMNEGPGHKQVLSALLLNRLSKLVETVEHNVNNKFTLQNGSVINVEKDGNNNVLPILFPINLDSNFDIEEVAEAISHAPEHEALAYGMCLQVIEWSIKSLAKKLN